MRHHCSSPLPAFAWLPVLLVCFLFSSPLQVQASNFSLPTLSYLTSRSKLVLHARVISKSCQEDSSNQIFTRITLQILEVWNGEWPEPTLDLVHSGGRLGDRLLVVHGQVHFEMNEEVVVFLKKNDAGEWITAAMSKGRIPIQRPLMEDGFAGPPSSDANVTTLIQTSPSASRSTLATLTLHQLKKLIQQYAAGLESPAAK